MEEVASLATHCVDFREAHVKFFVMKRFDDIQEQSDAVGGTYLDDRVPTAAVRAHLHGTLAFIVTAVRPDSFGDRGPKTVLVAERAHQVVGNSLPPLRSYCPACSVVGDMEGVQGDSVGSGTEAASMTPIPLRVKA